MTSLRSILKSYMKMNRAAVKINRKMETNKINSFKS